MLITRASNSLFSYFSWHSNPYTFQVPSVSTTPDPVFLRRFCRLRWDPSGNPWKLRVVKGTNLLLIREWKFSLVPTLYADKAWNVYGSCLLALIENVFLTALKILGWLCCKLTNLKLWCVPRLLILSPKQQKLKLVDQILKPRT